ncbi:T9SS type A sorting domain-containing protein [candidate division KSB1 bacterium]|nr:T9SS type A sorting domain-containing protein [candidate division KSB1 bacterium]
MKKAISLFAVLALMCASWALADEVAVRVPLGTVSHAGLSNPTSRAGSCTVGLLDLNNPDPTFEINRFGADIGEVYKIYLDPATDQLGTNVCTPPYYPYHISSVDVFFVINGVDSTQNIGRTFTFTVDVECPADGPSPNVTRSCKGPGAAVASAVGSYTITSADWNGSQIIAVNVPIDACVSDAFFVGVTLDSWDGEALSYPGVLFQVNPLFPNQYCRVWAKWDLGRGPCFFVGNVDVGCGAGCNIGPWGIYANGESEAACTPAVCIPCPNNLVGEAADDPIHVNGTPWTADINLCNYCSDYDFSLDNELFGVWAASFTGPGGDVVLQIDPIPGIPANLTITIVPMCSPTMTQFRLRWWLKDVYGTYASAGIAPFGFPGYGASVTISSAQVGLFDAANGPIQLFIDTRNCCCPIRVTVTGDQILPVEITSFNATAGNGEVTLNWSTASETHIDRYDVVRNDGEVVGSVESLGDNAAGHTYSFVDRGLENGRTYNYQLQAYNLDGAVVTQTEVVNATPHSGLVANEYALAQNFPNPFNPSTQISYSLKETGLVTLKVFAIDGREVATLVNRSQESGVYTVDFDGNSLASGVYMYTLDVNGFSASHKMVLMK